MAGEVPPHPSDEVTATVAAPASAPGDSGPGGPAAAFANAAHEATAEWPSKAADMVDSLVALVHDKALRPLLLVARGVVFGLLAATVATTVVVFVAIGLIRLLTVYAFPGRVWASYALVGFVFCVAGALAWSRRSPRGDKAAS